MFPDFNKTDWSALTDKAFAKAIAQRSKQQHKVMTKPVADLTNDEMLKAIKAGRFDKPK